jgi:hypothetical protein
LSSATGYAVLENGRFCETRRAPHAVADRTLTAPGMIHAGDATERAFTTRGWTWDTPIDYQHLEKP